MTSPSNSIMPSYSPRQGIFLAHHSSSWQEWVGGIRNARAFFKGNPLRAYELHPLELHNTRGCYSSWQNQSGQICEMLRYTLLEDESSWARAMILLLLKALCDEGKFESSIKKIYEAVRAFSPNNPDVLLLNRYAGDAIEIFYEMRTMNRDERLVYLNHERVDESLLFFVRHVAGESMSRYDATISNEYIAAVKNDRHMPNSGYEPLAFCCSLGLEFNQIVRHEGQWTLAHKAASATSLSYLALDQATLPTSCEIFFPVNETHCEYLSLVPLLIEPPLPSQVSPTDLPKSLKPVEVSMKELFQDFLLLLAFRGVEVDLSLIEVQMKELGAYQSAWKQMQSEEAIAHQLLELEQQIALKKRPNRAGAALSPKELSSLSLAAQKRVIQMQKRREESSFYGAESWIQRVPKVLAFCWSQLLTSLLVSFHKKKRPNNVNK